MIIMEQNYIFKEQQRFRQWWLWLIILAIDAVLIYGFVQQLIFGKPFGEQPMSDAGLALAVVLSLALTIFSLSIRLETLISRDGVSVRFFPLHFKFKVYTWAHFSKSYVRKYAPLSEYGGWGLRFGLSGQGTAYNVSGNKGLQLEFTDRKRLLIGTRKPEELSLVLKEIGQLRT